MKKYSREQLDNWPHVDSDTCILLSLAAWESSSRFPHVSESLVYDSRVRKSYRREMLQMGDVSGPTWIKSHFVASIWKKKSIYFYSG